MALQTLVMSRTEVSDALGEGSRVARAVITTTWNGVDDPVSSVQTVIPGSLLSAELTDVQVFMDGLDELVTAQETAIQGE